MSFIHLTETVTIKKPNEDLFDQLRDVIPLGWGRRDYGDLPGDYQVYALFKIISQDFSQDFDCYKTEGTSSCLSLYSMVQGVHHLTSFASGAEISEDFYDITSDKVLRLPLNYNQAIKYINENLIGKTLRIIARTAPNTTKFGGRYYLFVIED